MQSEQARRDSARETHTSKSGASLILITLFLPNCELMFFSVASRTLACSNQQTVSFHAQLTSKMWEFLQTSSAS